jgi:heat shock protein HslJ
MKKILPLLLLVIALAACAGAEATPTAVPDQPTAVTQPEPTDAPTAVPQEQPTAEPTQPGAYIDSLEHTPDPALIDITWQWVRRDDSSGNTTLTVPDPQNYTVLFNADGTFNAQLDCNNGNGRYATPSAGAIFMELGAMTMAACREDSLAVAMANMFGPAQSYRFEDDGQTLVFSWAAAGGADYYRNAAAGADSADEAALKAIPADAIILDTTGLAESFAWTVIEGTPFTDGPDGAGTPDHILLTFDGQSPEEALGSRSPHLFIFPVQAYLDLYAAAGDTSVATQISRLSELVAQADGRAALPEGFMPLLPPPTSLMDRWAQFLDLDFGAGTGVRYVSDAPDRRDLSAWTNDTSGYYYQGLSSDGQYYVSLYWPVSTESLPATAADTPEELAAQSTDPATYPAYLAATKDTLNALPAAAWTPALALLDAMVGSLNFPMTAGQSLTGTTWAWVSQTTPVTETIVKDPARYTVLFNEDGTANIIADCNSIGATYTSDGSSLSITPGASTLVACADDSQGDEFLAGLESAALYFFQDGDLYIDRFASAGTMRFSADIPVTGGEAEAAATPEPGTASATVTAVDGIFVRSGPGTEYPDIGVAATDETWVVTGRTEDGTWLAIAVPITWAADGQGWVSAEFVELSDGADLPVIEAQQITPGLTGITWQWLSLTDPLGVTAVNDPASYTILFNNDGSAPIKADCNNVGATYTTDGSAISITPGPSTRVACPEGSLEETFLNGLTNAAITFFQNGDLYLDLAADAGTMRFSAASSAAPPAAPTPEATAEAGASGDPLAGGATGVLFRVVSFGPVGGEQAIIEGTTITATFSNTDVNGNAGCNDYSGRLTPVNDYFTVNAIAVTEKACLEPAGIMEQEQSYLAALDATNGYQWNNGLVNETTVVTAGQLSYLLPDGTSGVINLVAQ